jgi:hypothetical protein
MPDAHDEDLMEFHLLDENGELYWAEYAPHPNGGDMAYLNQQGSGWQLTGEEVVVRKAHAEDWRDLDWSETSLVDPKSAAGWLDRAGRFHGCPHEAHDTYADLVLKTSAFDLENAGWVRVYGEGHLPLEWVIGYRSGLRLSDEQRMWLDRKGMTVHEWD